MVPVLLETLASCENPILAGIRQTLDTDRLAVVADAISEAVVDEPPLTIKEGGLIRDGYDAELDDLRGISRAGVNWIAQFQQQESEEQGIEEQFRQGARERDLIG